MRQILLPLLIGTLLLFASCNKKVLIDDTHTFANDTWNRFTPEVYNVDADNLDDCYNFFFTVEIDTIRYEGKQLPIMVNIFSPAGEQRQISYTLLLKDKDGHWTGEWHDGRLSHTRCIRQYFFFNTTGGFRFEITQTTPRYDLHGIHSAQLRIEQAKLEYPK